MVKKANDKWTIGIDYTDLNKAYPKDNFSIPRIDQLVDATSEHKLLSFIDAFSDYNHIRMTPKDEKNMTFITEKDLYYDKMILFDLKNIGVTFQHLEGAVS